jgi:hypothetical protein
MAQQSASRFDSPRLGPEGVMTPFDAIVELGRRWAAAPAPIAGGAALAGSAGRHREGGRALQHHRSTSRTERHGTHPSACATLEAEVHLERHRHAPAPKDAAEAVGWRHPAT